MANLHRVTPGSEQLEGGGLRITMSVITHLLTLTWLITARPDRDSDWDSKLGSRGHPQGLRLGWRWRAGRGGVGLRA